MKPSFRIERGAVAIYFPASKAYIHIRQGEYDKADVVIDELAVQHIYTLSAEELIDLLYSIKSQLKEQGA